MTSAKKQRVLITAGAGGIGRAIAAEFAANGSSIHVCDIDTEALKALVKDMPGVSTSVCDISVRSEVELMMQDAIAALGGLDVLVNNAGVSGPSISLQDLDLGAWEAVLRVNLTGTFNVTQLAIPHLKASGAGSIVVMSSLAGRFGYTNRSPYATTKWGLIGLTKTLARELGDFGVRVNAILPGGVDGPRLGNVLEGRARTSGHSIEQEREAALSIQLVKRFVDPADIAAMAVFLSSDSARSISGQMIPIDGDSQSAC